MFPTRGSECCDDIVVVSACEGLPTFTLEYVFQDYRYRGCKHHTCSILSMQIAHSRLHVSTLFKHFR